MDPFDLALKNYQFVLEALSKEKESSKSNPVSFTRRYKLDHIGQKAKDIKNKLNDFFDQSFTSLNELYYLQLISIFEKEVFEKYSNALIKAKSVVSENYSGGPFFKTRTSLVREQDELKGINTLNKLIIDKNLDDNLKENLQIIIDYRNFIAHGKRFSTEKSNTFEAKFNHETLTRFLKDILDKLE